MTDFLIYPLFLLDIQINRKELKLLMRTLNHQSIILIFFI